MSKITVGLVLLSVLLGCSGESSEKSGEPEANSTTGSTQDAPKPEPETKGNKPESGTVAGKEKVKGTDLKVGDGTIELGKRKVKFGKTPQVAEPGDLVLMMYKGTLNNGTQFDTNEKPDGSPLSFVLGGGDMIKGWDLGIPGMAVGGKRRLEVPSVLAYGNGERPGIPPNSDLNFDVILVDVVKKGEEEIFDRKDIKVGAGRVAKEGSTVKIKYVGLMMNGRPFEQEGENGTELTFKIGQHKALPGLEAGVTDMKVGGMRWLRIPPLLAHGMAGSGIVGPNQTLFFEVTLVDVK